MRFLIVATLALAATGEESSSIDNVQRTIGEIKFSGTRNGGIARGRKMIVEHMLSKISASASSAFTPEAAAIVTNTIIPILNNIIGDLEDEAKDDNNQLNGHATWAYNPYTEWDYCNESTQYATDINERADTVAYYNDLKTHRVSMVTNMLVDPCADASDCDSKMQDACETLRTTWNSHRGATCLIPSTQTSQRSSIESWLNTDATYRNWLSIYMEFVHNRDECDYYYGEYSAVDALADSNQTAFEAEYCHFANVRLDRCFNLDNCLDRLNRHRAQQKSIMEARDLVRIQDVAALNYSICILTELVTNTTATLATNACQNLLGHDWTSYPDYDGLNTANYDLRAYSMGDFPALPDTFASGRWTQNSCTVAQVQEAYALGDIRSAHETPMGWAAQEFFFLEDPHDSLSAAIAYGDYWRDTLNVKHKCTRVATSYCRPGTSWAGIPCVSL